MKYENPITSTPSSLMSFVMKKRQQKQFRQTFEISVTLLFISFFLIFAIRPTVLTITSLIAEINTKKDLAEKYKKKINSVIQAQTVYSQAQSNYQLINASLPDNYRFSQAATQIKGISQTAGIPVTQIDFGLSDDIDEVYKAPYYTYNFSQNINFDNISTLINGIINNRRCIQLTNLTISSPQETKPSQEVEPVTTDQTSLSIGTQIYYWTK